MQQLDKDVLDLEKNDIEYLKLGDHKVPIGMLSIFPLFLTVLSDVKGVKF